jgi:hypothetical protein
MQVSWFTLWSCHKFQMDSWNCTHNMQQHVRTGHNLIHCDTMLTSSLGRWCSKWPHMCIAFFTEFWEPKLSVQVSLLSACSHNPNLWGFWWLCQHFGISFLRSIPVSYERQLSRYFKFKMNCGYMLYVYYFHVLWLVSEHFHSHHKISFCSRTIKFT